VSPSKKKAPTVTPSRNYSPAVNTARDKEVSNKMKALEKTINELNIKNEFLKKENISLN
jgi:hypothetical protein